MQLNNQTICPDIKCVKASRRLHRGSQLRWIFKKE